MVLARLLHCATPEYMLPWAHPSPYLIGTSVGSAYNLRTAHGKGLYTLKWAVPPPVKIVTLCGGSETHLIGLRGSLGPRESTPQTTSRIEILDRFCRFCRVHDRHRQSDRQTDHATRLFVTIDKATSS